MKKVDKLLLILICFSFYSCKLNNTELIVELESSEIKINDYQICESEQGFNIYFDSVTNEKFKSQKVKRILLKNGKDMVEVGLFNIFYSSKNDVKHQTPVTPKGFLATFKANKEFSIEILSSKKSEIFLLLKETNLKKCKDD